MKSLSIANHPYFAVLLLWRAILALFALHAVLEKPFAAMLMSISVLGVLVVAGEFAYKAKVHLDEVQRQKALDRELKERRAEEARLRLEAAKAEPANERKSFGLDDDVVEPVAGVPDGGLGTMSAEDFDIALVEAKM